MRTTIRLDEGLLRQAKLIAGRTGRSVGAVIEEAVRESFARRDRGLRKSRAVLPSYPGKGLQPGVDLDDTAGLLDRMDGSGR
jgi:hypothetical protein